tara:strand:- start:304 stop:429 length:126 start_codon:yes stop_codon:yes gene_type:complete
LDVRIPWRCWLLSIFIEGAKNRKLISDRKELSISKAEMDAI